MFISNRQEIVEYSASVWMQKIVIFAVFRLYLSFTLQFTWRFMENHLLKNHTKYQFSMIFIMREKYLVPNKKSSDMDLVLVVSMVRE
ncbi:hypothetical protein Mpet_1834 [Methanolacinia petrolearia DSM 11571]|uniref:Uncharacterized protein n=1 Tax=Methanolacinia petrolearia (strain DSM 11571 / OCM 486 / SEBR 4847) TaxID=679926 RepID=E1RIC1_METP4|nr:hypothetical protein Mpet_1834 [Methanolacinia petrolearia DSM 11571]